jgi:hypothetical protein
MFYTLFRLGVPSIRRGGESGNLVSEGEGESGLSWSCLRWFLCSGVRAGLSLRLDHARVFLEHGPPCIVACGWVWSAGGRGWLCAMCFGGGGGLLFFDGECPPLVAGILVTDGRSRGLSV